MIEYRKSKRNFKNPIYLAKFCGANCSSIRKIINRVLFLFSNFLCKAF